MENSYGIFIQIKHLDDTLRLLREGWMNAKNEDKPKWMEKINAALDHRKTLMNTRDNFPGQPGLTN